ncbi:hypothetical protein Hypma_003397 [Hypsizygus marmoreus]|uniref:Uncharacterized protein n=1 Tax=Hypsizygus marmoreus TaxID=39966 RepID=A0A369J3X4_HYPMA|nr:hypothetical protein Hypma_003397 [Hypsizygus marmoreus]
MTKRTNNTFNWTIPPISKLHLDFLHGPGNVIAALLKNAQRPLGEPISDLDRTYSDTPAPLLPAGTRTVEHAVLAPYRLALGSL